MKTNKSMLANKPTLALYALQTAVVLLSHGKEGRARQRDIDDLLRLIKRLDKHTGTLQRRVAARKHTRPVKTQGNAGGTVDGGAVSGRVSDAKITEFLQDTLWTRHLDRVSAVEAARWLDAAGILRDEPERPGLPLRKRLRERDGSIIGARQENEHWWYIDRVAR